MIQLTRQPIDTTAILQQAGSNLAGAVVLFLGVTREVTGDAVTKSLEYECYEEMASSELQKLEDAARERWPITGCVIVHRLGQVDIQQASVAIAVSSPHRKAAFEAGQWLIDTLKETVPIWKKEQWATGGEEWVHPVTGEPQTGFQPDAASDNAPEQAS